jgi:BTB/POZ domain-containing protein KCTD9
MSNSEKSMQCEQASPPLAMGRSITLQVGERWFVTTAETITHERIFFAALFSGRWDNVEADGSDFIDADPELFEHILRYLRRGVLPTGARYWFR